MTIPYLKYKELQDLLNDNGYEIVEGKYWEEYNRIIIQKGSVTFPLQYKEVYHYPFVVRLCRMLSIEPPADHLKCFEQHEDLKRKEKE